MPDTIIQVFFICPETLSPDDVSAIVNDIQKCAGKKFENIAGFARTLKDDCVQSDWLQYRNE